MENKLIIFKPTGEVRSPGKGEWYWYNGAYYMSKIDPIKDDKHDIYERIVIQVPEGAQCLAYYFCNTNAPIKGTNDTIIFHRQKIKKWLWKCVNTNSSSKLPMVEWQTIKHFTEEEIRKAYFYNSCSEMEFVKKLPDSEIETEG